jgi:hypothetical protein
MGAIDLAHSTGPEWRPDRIRAEPPAGEHPFFIRRGASERRRFEKRIRGARVLEQRLDFAPQRRVARAQIRHRALARTLGECQNGTDHVLDLPPALRRHR